MSTEKSLSKPQVDKDNYTNADIEEKIIILKKLGLSKVEIFEKLKNNMEFKELIKNENKRFDMIYDEDSK